VFSWPNFHTALSVAHVVYNTVVLESRFTRDDFLRDGVGDPSHDVASVAFFELKRAREQNIVLEMNVLVNITLEIG
jgi:hypothetical protein